MKKLFSGILLLCTSFALHAIPFFPCDSVIISSVNPNNIMNRIEVMTWNTSHVGFNSPEMTGTLVANPYITIGTNPGTSAFLDVVNGPNNGFTGFALYTSNFAASASVPSGTVFTGTVTLYNPNDLSVSCDYPISFTYGTGPVGIASFLSVMNTPAYPNPANETIVLGENTADQKGEWLIFDQLGNLVLTSASSRIDIAALPSGMYFFRNEERIGKFVKL